jgi:hypothetical protein
MRALQHVVNKKLMDNLIIGYIVIVAHKSQSLGKHVGWRWHVIFSIKVCLVIQHRQAVKDTSRHSHTLWLLPTDRKDTQCGSEGPPSLEVVSGVDAFWVAVIF